MRRREMRGPRDHDVSWATGKFFSKKYFYLLLTFCFYSDDDDSWHPAADSLPSLPLYHHHSPQEAAVFKIRAQMTSKRRLGPRYLFFFVELN
jgi:hypothetical protein